MRRFTFKSCCWCEWKKCSTDLFRTLTQRRPHSLTYYWPVLWASTCRACHPCLLQPSLQTSEASESQITLWSKHWSQSHSTSDTIMTIVTYLSITLFWQKVQLLSKNISLWSDINTFFVWNRNILRRLADPTDDWQNWLLHVVLILCVRLHWPACAGSLLQSQLWLRV